MIDYKDGESVNKNGHLIDIDTQTGLNTVNNTQINI
jgi:hypothetical protein